MAVYIHVSMELATTEPMVLRYERVYVQHWDDVIRFLLASSEGSGGYAGLVDDEFVAGGDAAARISGWIEGKS